MTDAPFPGGRRKALTFSFDDGEHYDERLASLFRSYGLKATFYLVGGQLGLSIPHARYGAQTVVRRVSAEEIPSVYAGMEVGAHTMTHHLSVATVESEAVASAILLGKVAGDVTGLAYPGGLYDDSLVEALLRTPIAYARTVQYTHRLAPPERLLLWHPTCRYDDPALPTLAEAFLTTTDACAVLHVVGHSYELERPEAGWAAYASMLGVLAHQDSVWYATNGAIARCLKDAGIPR